MSSKMISQSYSKKPINEIMQELDQLGGSSQVRMMEDCLIAITGHSQDINKYTIQQLQASRQFLVARGSKKKYYYNGVYDTASKGLVVEPLVQTYNQFHANILLLGMQSQELFQFIPKTDGMALSRAAYNLINDGAIDLISGNELPLRSDPEFYSFDEDIILQTPTDKLVVTRIVYPNKSYSELRIIQIPRLLTMNDGNSSRNQLIQLLEFLRKNKQKFGKDYLTKLFIKKNRAISILIDTVFENSLNWIVNYIGQKITLDEKLENLEFANRFKGLPCFVKRVDRRELKIKQWVSIKKTKSKSKDKKKPRASPNTREENILIAQPMTHQTQVDIEKSEFSYCRSLERKTHKYSVSPSPACYEPEPNKLAVQPSNLSSLPIEEQVSVLKSAHMIEISKYHQTIQSLNAKLLSLTQEKGIEELCNIYEREIMQLELKIQEMRKEMVVINEGEEKGLKGVIKRLNQQLGKVERQRRWQTQKKQIVKIHEDENNQLKRRLQQSENARLILSEQLKELSKRLEVREQQVSSLNKKIQNFTSPNENTLQKPTLNVKTEKQYSELVALLQQLNNGNGMSYVFIRKRISTLFETLSLSKKSLVQCHDFLLELQNQLEAKISNVNPTLVLDCNRFIRGFMMKCLEVQE